MRVQVKNKDMPWRAVGAMFFVACGCGCFILSCVAGMLIYNNKR